jgi:hypothetical protein
LSLEVSISLVTGEWGGHRRFGVWGVRAWEADEHDWSEIAIGYHLELHEGRKTF